MCVRRRLTKDQEPRFEIKYDIYSYKREEIGDKIYNLSMYNVLKLVIIIINLIVVNVLVCPVASKIFNREHISA